MSEIVCTITITELEGATHIHANIPEGAEHTIAGQLATRLLMGAQVIMNKVTGQDAQIQRGH